MSRPIFANIDLKAIRKNYLLAKNLSSKNLPIAVIKANAYGCGILEVAKTLADDCKIFAVSSLEEASLLRQNSIKNQILLLEGFFENSEIEYIAQQNIIPVIHNEFQLRSLQESNLREPLNIWLKFNTGMNRLGFNRKQILDILQKGEKGNGAYQPTTLITHFANADIEESQVCKNAYKQAFDLAEETSMALSASNSAGILGFDFANDYTRPGIMLYGASPLTYENTNSQKIARVVELKSKILAIHNIEAGEAVGYGRTFIATKPTKIATIAGGYGDGFSREDYKAPVYLQGVRCPIIGRISMDMMSIDISQVENVRVGDEVEFFGDNIKIEEVANINSTISYTLITQLMQRVERFYLS